MRVLLTVLAVLSFVAISQAANTYYYTGFEQYEQDTAFTTGFIAGQGTPAWKMDWHGSAPAWGWSGAYVANATGPNGNTAKTPYAGEQDLCGYSGWAGEAYVELASKVQPKWVEFAFAKSNWDPQGESRMYIGNGLKGGTETSYIQIDMIDAAGTDGSGPIVIGGVTVGNYVKGQWYTLGLANEVDGGVLTGRFEVYLDGVKKALIDSSANFNGGVQLFAVTNYSDSWGNNGRIWLDEINIGDVSLFGTPEFVPEPATMSLLLLGAAALRRCRK